MKFKTLLAVGLGVARKHEGLILTIVSMSTTVAAVAFALKDSKDICEALDEIRENKEMTSGQKFVRVAKPMARTATCTAISLFAQGLNNKRFSDKLSSMASMVTMYKTLSDQKDKAMAETLDEDQVKDIKEKAHNRTAGLKDEDIKAQKQAFGECPTRRYTNTGQGDELFHDILTNSWFYSERNFIKDRVRDMDEQAMYESVGVNEYMMNLMIPYTDGFEDQVWKMGDRIKIRLRAAKLEDNDRLYYEIEQVGDKPKDWEGHYA